ncbi:hypothetical protein [Pontibacter pamirensis]|uniref:hypothetical protein n=1 Tax=Pontibacter pamirensis TaxID=2562824 RepID=UPI001389EFEF|nr:hypothetical protein [Pontibacter pamirensis]
MKNIPGYGRGPVHLLGVIFCYILAIYAGVKLFSNVSLWIALAFPAGIFLHDFVLFPLYSGIDRGLKHLQRRQQREEKVSVGWVNHVRVPVMISFFLLLAYFPIILRLSDDRYLYFANHRYLSIPLASGYSGTGSWLRLQLLCSEAAL